MSSKIIVNQDMNSKDKKILLAKFQKIREEYEWIFENIEQLQKEYPNKYVAVKDENVKFSANNMREIISIIKNANRKTEEFVIDHIRTREVTLLL